MGEIKRLAFHAEKAHTHHTENSVPKMSAIQTVADTSKFSADDIRYAYDKIYGEKPSERQ